MKSLVVKSNIMPPFQLLVRIRQNEVFVANLPLFATKQFVTEIFSQFGKVYQCDVREHNSKEKQFQAIGEIRAARIAVVKLDANGILQLNDIVNKADFVVLDTKSIQSHCILQQLYQKQQQQVSDDWQSTFLKMLDEIEKPKEVGGWKINYNYDVQQSQRKKKANNEVFLQNFYKKERKAIQQDEERLKKDAEFIQWQKTNGMFKPM